jgi:N-acetylglucosaminyldiphosphoundecaprenol N-acetyl-beta-D-mannosaminyltransferase
MHLSRRVHGSDIVEKVCARIAKQPITVGFLGGKQNVAERAAERLVKKYPGLKVSFAQSEFEIRSPESEFPSADILFVAFGSPKQEKWLSRNLPKLNVNVAMGVGGTFDFISGRVKRAPVWVRNLGLEWLFRLIIQPWRVKRQLQLPVFILTVLKEKFANF